MLCCCVRFAGTDYRRVCEVVCSKPCQDRMISLQRLAVTTSIQVHGVSSLDEDAVQMYFESRRSGGSGELKNFMFDAQRGCAIVEFNDQQSQLFTLGLFILLS